MIDTAFYTWIKGRIIIFLFIFPSFGLPAAIAQVSLSDWFRVHEDALQHWELVPGGHPLQASLYPRYSASKPQIGRASCRERV